MKEANAGKSDLAFFLYPLLFFIHSVALKPTILASASFALYRQWIILFLAAFI